MARPRCNSLRFTLFSSHLIPLRRTASFHPGGENAIFGRSSLVTPTFDWAYLSRIFLYYLAALLPSSHPDPPTRFFSTVCGTVRVRHGSNRTSFQTFYRLAPSRRSVAALTVY